VFVLLVQVGIFDADVYGPSLPLMINPEIPILEMDPEVSSARVQDQKREGGETGLVLEGEKGGWRGFRRGMRRGRGLALC
jgi:hypothetical protein